LLCKDKVALVTGGASGIGRATAILFANEGAAVTVADINAVEGEAAVAEIRKAGGRAIFVRTDVTSELDVRDMVARTVAEFGGLDMAFNNVGINARSSVMNDTEEEWEREIAVNMSSVRYCMRHEIPAMLQRGGGAIVNTSSRAGDSAIYNAFGYVATKHAVAGMTKAAALDLGAKNIRVNALLPGFVQTPMFAETQKRSPMASPESVRAKVPLGRTGRPEEQAEAVVWLCSDRSSYVSGHLMIVDGGMAACI
jgi:NAD(P)-dependent dehydrogenase (short-subunit alcohol dehydrogenase family)